MPAKAVACSEDGASRRSAAAPRAGILAENAPERGMFVPVRVVLKSSSSVVWTQVWTHV